MAKITSGAFGFSALGGVHAGAGIAVTGATAAKVGAGLCATGAKAGTALAGAGYAKAGALVCTGLSKAGTPNSP